MTLRFVLLNLSFLSLTQWLFIKLTSASSDVQPFLHGAFGIAASSYPFCVTLWVELTLFCYFRERITIFVGALAQR